jgi:hypothetical protein
VVVVASAFVPRDRFDRVLVGGLRHDGREVGVPRRGERRPARKLGAARGASNGAQLRALTLVLTPGIFEVLPKWWNW